MRPVTYLLASVAFATILPCQLVGSFLPIGGNNGLIAALAQSSGAQQVETSTPGAQVDKSVKAKKEKKRSSKGDDFSGTRDLNLFQLEPSVINERYYTSGKAEHSQHTSPTLPYGAPIPDNEGPYAPAANPPTTKSGKPLSDKLDTAVKDSLKSLNNVDGESPVLKLKIRFSTIDDALIEQLKSLNCDVISSERASGDMLVYAPAKKVNDIGNLNQTLIVMLAQ